MKRINRNLNQQNWDERGEYNITKIPTKTLKNSDNNVKDITRKKKKTVNTSETISKHYITKHHNIYRFYIMQSLSLLFKNVLINS